MTILVTGGAGYIGSHVVRMLGEAGERILIVDDLSTGIADSVLYGDLVVGDIDDAGLLDQLFEQHDIEAVMHFAASTIVPESVENPLKYYRNNAANTLTLLQACKQHGVGQFVFSSTAAVYGIPENGIASERSALRPINPYGLTKLHAEQMLVDLSRTSDIRHVTLRYFNVAGADPQYRIGQSTKKATLLIKVACEAALGQRDGVDIFGTDYPTPDGTGVRDYIHVEDLTAAHLKALEYLRDGGNTVTLNCGYGHGYSVREVLDEVRRASGVDFECRVAPRRAGDPPTLIAECQQIRELFGWQPRLDRLETIVEHALAWERKLLDRSQVSTDSGVDP